MSRLPNIALIGKMGAGKTTCARLLIEHFAYQRVAFADVLKDTTARLWGAEAREDRDKNQRLGQAVRDIDEDTWVRLLIERINEPGQDVPYVVDDVRYHNEAWALKGEGFVTVRIEAEKSIRIDRVKRLGKLAADDWEQAQQLNHLSETSLDDWPEDYKVRNLSATTMADLLADLTRIIRAEGA
jgi:dephospho-CoA kinase